ncbi:hypothetical protein [Klebsiella pneumoniae]
MTDSRYSLRVPVPVVSIVDLTVTLERDVTVEGLLKAMLDLSPRTFCLIAQHSRA